MLRESFLLGLEIFAVPLSTLWDMSQMQRTKSSLAFDRMAFFKPGGTFCSKVRVPECFLKRFIGKFN